MAKLFPVPSGTRLGELPAPLKSLPRLGEESESFSADVDAAREELETREPGREDEWFFLSMVTVSELLHGVHRAL